MKITAALSRDSSPAPQLVELDQEPPRAGEMRIRLVATGICHTDLHEHPGRHAPHPIVLGHEGAGVVEELGEGITNFAIGDHVILSGSSCGKYWQGGEGCGRRRAGRCRAAYRHHRGEHGRGGRAAGGEAAAGALHRVRRGR